MGVPVVVDWWVSLRRVPPKEAMVALVSKPILVVADWDGEGVDDEEDEAEGQVLKCRESCESLEATVECEVEVEVKVEVEGVVVSVVIVWERGRFSSLIELV